MSTPNRPCTVAYIVSMNRCLIRLILAGLSIIQYNGGAIGKAFSKRGENAVSLHVLPHRCKRLSFTVPDSTYVEDITVLCSILFM
ncbi:MAG: hypothetical protein ACXV5E_03390, partial [Halobacteriota archaeon]